MKDSTLGILIIIFFIFMGIISGGSIFRPGGDRPTTTHDEIIDSPYYTTDTDKEIRNQNAREQLRLISADAVDLNRKIQEKVEEENASVYSDRVYISSIRNVGTFNEYAVLGVKNNQGESVLLSGWKLRSTVTGGEMTIGGAVNIPEFGLTSENPIIISERRATVIVSHAISPIRQSFRANICMGYLDENDYFEPSLGRSCPSPSKTAPSVSNITNNDCLDYIETISRCEIPKERDYPEEITRSCKEYIEENVNYESCVAKHQFDENFFIDEWRVFAKVRGILWLKDRDVIQLIDNSGKIVDVYRFDN